MFRTRSRRPVDRRGMILMVVLTLITLFAIIGIAFVLVAGDQQTGSRIAREGFNRTTDEPPDAKPYVDVVLTQLMYPIADNDPVLVTSGFRGHELARHIYGNDIRRALGMSPLPPDLNRGISPFAGQGLFTPLDLGMGDSMLIPGLLSPVLRSKTINHSVLLQNPIATQYSIDPEWSGFRVGVPLTDTTSFTNGTRQYKNIAAPYTAPDKDLYLAVLDPTNGQVLQPSFHRTWIGPDMFGPLTPPTAIVGPGGNDNWLNPAMRPYIIRPMPIDHIWDSGDGRGPVSDFPYCPPNGYYDPSSPYRHTGDVQNLPHPLGYQINDAIWVYPAGPIRIYNGKRYTALVAPTIIDLSGRVNLTTAGNRAGGGRFAGVGGGHASALGVSPAEINAARVLSLAGPPTEAAAAMDNVLTGLQGFNTVSGMIPLIGRYGTPAGNLNHPHPPTDRLSNLQAYEFNRGQVPSQYSRADVDGVGAGAADRMNPVGAAGTTSPFPTMAPTRFDYAPYTFGVPAQTRPQEYSRHPSQTHVDFWNPGTTGGRTFSLTDTQRLATRYGGLAASYANTDVGRLAPRQLISANYDPNTQVFNPNNPTDPTYTASGYLGTPYHTVSDTANLVRQLTTTFSSSMSRPELTVRTSPGTFAKLGPIDLARPLPDLRRDTNFPLGMMLVAPSPYAGSINMLPATIGGPGYIAGDYRKYAIARRARQNLAKDVFVRLVALAEQYTQLPPPMGLGALLIDGTEIYYDDYAPTAVPARLGTGYLVISPTLLPTDPRIILLRALAQVAANVVDYLDHDDTSMPFLWRPISLSGPGTNDAAAASEAVPPETSFYDPSVDPANYTDALTIGNCVVFGTELPRLVLNEVYAMLGNHQSDLPPAMGTAANNWQVKVWLELHNPLTAETGAALSEMGSARLYHTAATSPTGAPYPVHQIVVTDHPAGMANQFSAALVANPANVTGDPVVAGLAPKIQVTDYTPAPGFTNVLVPDPSVVTPAGGSLGSTPPPATPDPNTGVYVPGYFVVGPQVEPPGMMGAQPSNGFPGGDVPCTLRLPYPPPAPPPGAPVNSMSYATTTNAAAGAVGLLGTTHTAYLRRLANPYLPPNDPNTPTYVPGAPLNPYITVDYVEGIPTRDQIFFDSTGPYGGRTFAGGGAANNASLDPSVGKRHGYASGDQVYDDTALPGPPPMGGITGSPAPNTNQNQYIQRQAPAAAAPPYMPYHTFFGVNSPFSDQSLGAPGAPPPNPPRWLVHLDRQPVNPLEMLHVSAVPPYNATRHFGTTNGVPGPAFTGQMNAHSVEAAFLPGLTGGLRRISNFVMPTVPPSLPVPGDILVPDGFLFKALDFLTTRPAYAGMPVGGREYGRVNVNTAAHSTVFRSIFDANDGNHFTDAQVAGGPDTFWERLTGSLTDTRGFNPPSPTFAAPGDPVWALGHNLSGPPDPNRTVVRPATASRLFYNTLELGSTGDPTHAHAIAEPLKKVWNSTTTTSNAFLVVMTFGFFEVRHVDPVSGRVYLGKEMFERVPGDMRQKYASIIDRSNLAMETDPTGLVTSQTQPTQAAEKPWFACLAEDAVPGATTIKVFAATNDIAAPVQALIYLDGSPIALTNRRLRLGIGDGNAVPGNVFANGGDSEVLVTNGLAPAPSGWVNGVATIMLDPSTPITRYHPAGSALSGGTSTSSVPLLGNPGPQARFDYTDPRFRAVVPYCVKLVPGEQ